MRGWTLSLTVACLLAGGALAVAAQDVATDAERARTHIANIGRGGGFWATSNARYRTSESGEPSEYRMAFERSVDGYTMQGCMWGDVEAGTVVFWRFFMGWDPEEEALLEYQVHPAGIIGRGWSRFGTENVLVSLQRMHAPGQPPAFSRHVQEVAAPDTLRSRSFSGEPGEWEPERSYTWVWNESPEATPCA